jgi:hypothetical protein
MPVSGHPIPRPQRHRSDTMGNEVEASTERLRNHLRRPDADEDQLIMKPPLTPLIGQTLGATLIVIGVPGGVYQVNGLRREALLVRVEVRDLCRLLVAVGGWS